MKNRYIVIQEWMIKELELQGAELLVYAVIFGFTQDNESKFFGNWSYISEFLGLSRSSIKNSLKSLTEKGLIEKEIFGPENKQSVVYATTCNYMQPLGGQNVTPDEQNLNGGQNVDDRGSDFKRLGGQNLNPYNNNIYNNNYNNSENSVFTLSEEDSYLNQPEKEKEKNSAEKEKDREYLLEFYYGLCSEYFPTHLQPKDLKTKNKWKETLDKLQRIDKIPFDSIVHITSWARVDDFWAKNFLSLVKLRKKNKDGIPYVVVFSEQMKDTKKHALREAASKNLQGWG